MMNFEDSSNLNLLQSEYYNVGNFFGNDENNHDGDGDGDVVMGDEQHGKQKKEIGNEMGFPEYSFNEV